MTTFNGYLFSKLRAIGSRSEGPVYILQLRDYTELVAQKKVPLWERDPQLDRCLDKNVAVEGNLTLEGIQYSKISPWNPKTTRVKTPQLQLELVLGAKVVNVYRHPPGPNQVSSLSMTLRVKWPHRSIWHGTCPTTKIYDFDVVYKGKEIWRWSKGRMFGQMVTPVMISGGQWYEFREVWLIDPHTIPESGTYTARGVFVASGQEASASFRIKLVH